MGIQALRKDNIPPVVVNSTTQLALAATFGGIATRISFGSRQISLSSQLLLNTGTVGAGGLDAGSLGAVQLWYVYAILNRTTNVANLLASLSATAPTLPTGYTDSKMISAFYTNGSSQVGSTVSITGKATTEWMAYTPAVSNFGTIVGQVFYFKREGNAVRIRGGFSAGTTAAGQAAVNLPGSLTVSTIYTGRHVLVGFWTSGDSTADGQRSILAHQPSGADRVFFGYISTSQNGYDLQNGTNLPVSVSDGVVIDCEVIVSSWKETLF